MSTREAYSAELAQSKYDKAQKKKQGELKIGKNLRLIKYLQKSMKQDRNSPYVALKNAEREGLEINISLRTLYNCIHGELFLEFSTDDMIYRKDRRKREKIKKWIRKLESRVAQLEAIKGVIEYPEAIKTITSDNGSEFMKTDEIEGMGIGYFYAYSFCSWELWSRTTTS